MAGRLAAPEMQRPVYGEVNANISVELNELTPADYNPTGYPTRQFKQWGPYQSYRMAARTAWPIVGARQHSFFEDYYFRIHVTPQEIDLQTVASTQVREIEVWNAYPYSSAILQDILVNNPVGISVNGPNPYTYPPLVEQTYEIEIGTSGPANIDLQIQFDFSNATNPLPVLVTGTRAVKFDLVPEVPVNETWEWLSDNIVAIDGSEQRIALRGEVPRIEIQSKVIFDSVEAIRRFYADLMAAVGRLWIPEFQYATRTNGASLAGGFSVFFDNSKTDVRAGEYILIQTPLNTALVEVDTIETFGANLTSALTFDIPQSSLVIPGSPALISDNTAIARYPTNDAAELQLNSKLIRQRSQLARPGATVVLEQFGGVPILTKRPLADDLVRDEVSTGQISLDNNVGAQDIISRWDYSRIGGPRSFKVNRISNAEEMDYWKAILSYARGQARKFWMPTYRTDLKVIVTPADAATNYTVEGTQYGEKIWPIVTHRYIEIETTGGIHRTTIIGASTDEDGNSIILFDPAVPTGPEWMEVKRISYLLPVRLADDKVEWKHYGLESILNLSIRTAEP